MKQSLMTDVHLNTTESGDFDAFMLQIRNNVPQDTPLFTVNTEGLWDEYIGSFSNHDRQEYNCRCCKKFIDNFGGLVYLTPSGIMMSALWDTTLNCGFFNDTVRVLSTAVRGRAITSVVKSSESSLGFFEEGGWSHMAIRVPSSVVHTSVLLDDNQYMASKREDFRMLSRAVERHSLHTANKATSMLRGDTLFRSEKVLGQAEWFSKLVLSLKGARSYSNLIWQAVATTPPGYSNVNSSVLGSLLSDISEGYPDKNIIKRFNEKLDPTRYRRPQTAPGAQNVKRGEELFAKMGLERSLERRYAKLDDLDLLYRSTPQKASQRPSTGIFSNVQTRLETKARIQEVSGVTKMTFSRFAKRILPTADEVMLEVPSSGSFSALLTATHWGAPNILQWSNPVSWYLYHGGSRAHSWGLQNGKFAKVIGICLQPNMWNDECPNQGEAAFFLLEGCKDSRNSGLALFPEILKPELHEVRKTIEAYSNGGKATGIHDGDAQGYKFTDRDSIRVKVISNRVSTLYQISQMD